MTMTALVFDYSHLVQRWFAAMRHAAAVYPGANPPYPRIREKVLTRVAAVHRQEVVPALRAPWDWVFKRNASFALSTAYWCGLLDACSPRPPLMVVAARNGEASGEGPDMWASPEGYEPSGWKMVPRFVPVPLAGIELSHLRYLEGLTGSAPKGHQDLTVFEGVLSGVAVAVWSPALLRRLLAMRTGLLSAVGDVRYLRVGVKTDVFGLAEVQGKAIYAMAGARGLRAVIKALTPTVVWLERVAAARARAAQEMEPEAVLQ